MRVGCLQVHLTAYFSCAFENFGKENYDINIFKFTHHRLQGKQVENSVRESPKSPTQEFTQVDKLK